VERNSAIRPLVAAKPKPFAWLEDFPTTAATCLVAMVVIMLTAFRYLFMSPALPDLGAWLTFLGSLVTIVGGTVVGKRFSSDAAVITAEAAARQDPPPSTSVNAEGGIDVVPQAGAVQGPPPAQP